MNTAIPNVIEREVHLRAPKERVYAALTDPDLLPKWFPDGVIGTIAPGEKPLLDFGKWGRSRIHVVAADPYHYFAYRWVSGSYHMPGFEGDPLTKPNTLVEFHLEDADGGTKLRLVESGFASLPAEYFESNYNENCEGWDYMFDRLQTLAPEL